MNHADFQQRYEEESGKERARFDARSVADLLADVRAGRFGDQYQIWYSLGARATLAEAGPVLFEILESQIDYLHRYHCASALIAIARLDPQRYTPVSLSAHGAHPVRENLATLRQLLHLPPTAPGSSAQPLPAAARPAPQVATPPPLSSPPRFALLTILAWLVMIGSGLLLPISLISAAMLLVKSYGTASATPLGIATIVFGPAAGLVAGFGLWRRQRWAWFLAVAMLVVSIGVNLHAILTTERGTRQFVSPSGTLTTVTTEGASPLWAFVIFAALALLFLGLPRVRREFFR